MKVETHTFFNSFLKQTIVCAIVLLSISSHAQVNDALTVPEKAPKQLYKVWAEIYNGDTIPSIRFQEVYVYADYIYKDKKQYEAWTRTKYNVKKVYHVTLNKGLKPADFTAITEGIKLEDGLVKADDLAFVGEGKKDVGIEIHSGKNRIVRRIFEHLGYEVVKLDRVVYSNLTKKDLPRGKWRFLEEKEIIQLKHLIK